jgi:hypothetical protein
MSRSQFFFLTLLLCTASHAFVDEPAGCWGARKIPCAVRATKAGEAFYYSRPGAESFQFELIAAKKASWLLQQEGLKLLEGELWVKSSRDLRVETNQIFAVAQGEFWIQLQGSKTELKNLEAEFTRLQMTGLPGDGKRVSLPVGFENWYGGLNSDGDLNVGVLRPIDRVPFFSSWARQMKVSKPLAVEKIEKWREIWQAATDASSELYARVVERKIASEENRLREVQRRKDEAASEKRQLLQMFRERHSLGEP